MELELEQEAAHPSRTGSRQMSLRIALQRTATSFSSIRPVAYILIVLCAVGAGYISTLWDGIFNCQANGYAPDGFVAECSAPAYGDYEHGAFWFDLEPAAVDAATRAQVLFLGDSRVQVGFNTAATSNWFAKIAKRYYLLGFGWAENVAFTGKLLQKLKPQAKVLIINVDDFFEQNETPPARMVMRDPGALLHYEKKRFWQTPHRLICSRIPALCGTSYVVFRARGTGGYEIHGDHDAKGHWYRSAPVSYVRSVDQEKAARYIASGMNFISHASVGKQCMIATIIPYPGTKIGTAKAVAAGLGLNFIAPELDGLETFDASHLDRTSAERWTDAFYAAAGPQIRKCLDAR
jgi:hypothetical protein